MAIETWLAFAAASAVLLFVPGPTVLALAAYSAAHGRVFPLVAAVVLGDLTALCLSLFGLGALLKTSAAVFMAAKWAGGLYLIALGISFLFRAASAKSSPPVSPPRKKMFADIYFITAFNPKGIVFFTAFLPQFVASESAVIPQLIIFAATFLILAAANAAFYAMSAKSAGQFAGGKSRRTLEFAGGMALIGAGGWSLSRS